MFHFMSKPVNDEEQKQPLRGAHIKRCSKKTQQNYRRTPMTKSDFNKIARFIEIAIRHMCSLVNLMHIFRILFSKNTSGLLLYQELYFML